MPQPLFFADATKLVKTSLLTYVNGEIDFAFDLGASIQIARPFNLDLSSITDSLPGPLAGIVNTLIGAGGSGNLTVNVGANLHIALGLDLSQPASITRRLAPHQRDGRHVQGHLRRPHDRAARLERLRRPTCRPRFGCCRASAPRRSAGGAGTYTITGGTPSLFSVDGTSLTGSQRSFFLKTGSGDDDTHLDLTASAAGTNLNFNARLGPFGLFIKDGSASLGGTIRLNFLDRPARAAASTSSASATARSRATSARSATSSAPAASASTRTASASATTRS